MKNITFKIIALLFCVVLLLALPLTASAAESRLVDGANLLTPSEETALLSKLDALSAEYQLDIAVVTAKEFEGISVSNYAKNLYDQSGYGVGSDRSGILLFVSMAKRDYSIYANGEAYKVFNETDMTALENAFVDYLSNGEYSEAFDAYADKCEHIIKYDGRLSPVWIIVALCVGIVVAAIVVWLMCSKHKSIKMQNTANEYMRRDTFHLDRSRDVFLYSHVSRVRKQQSSSSSGRGSSGGGSRSRSGKF